jgi:16S rRNA (guanine1207-N2)-methyltransferase
MMPPDPETEVTNNVAAGKASGQYFESSPQVSSHRAEVRLDLPDMSFRLATDRGVFSADQVDTGTKILLRDGPRPATTGTIVDVGCGYGPITVALATRSPGAQIIAVDTNERARGLCRDNAYAAGLTNVAVLSPDEVADDLAVAEIWSNPPIRIGKAALHDLLAGWLARLVDGGRALLVVQKHLGADSLADWLGASGWLIERLVSRQGYRLLEVTRA